ncbi:MAG TPA: TetR/AcrR family transcriptional regulator [Thermoanaerobaculia bacterium]|nr:TetR/AcrR family transcriptional regulator [Thermoanaerobaculia bacterium]
MTETETRTEHHVDTREALLDAAEKLFSEHGIQASSLRMITQQAGANLAAVHYHFGSKEGLVRAVFSRRLRPLEDERFHLLAACDLSGEGLAIEQVIDAFVAPLIRRMRETPGGAQEFAQLMGRVFTEPSEEVRAMLIQELKPTADRFLGALRQLLPHLSDKELMWRFHFLAGGMGHTVSCRKMLARFSEELCDSGPDEMLRYLVTFMASGLRAPATAGPDPQGEPA